METRKLCLRGSTDGDTGGRVGAGLSDTVLAGKSNLSFTKDFLLLPIQAAELPRFCLRKGRERTAAQLAWVEVLSAGDEDVGQASKQRCGDAAAPVPPWALLPHFQTVVSSFLLFCSLRLFYSFLLFRLFALAEGQSFKGYENTHGGRSEAFQIMVFPRIT